MRTKEVESDNSCSLELKGDRPENIFVINYSSSSLKYYFYDSAEKIRRALGLIERIDLVYPIN
jgi:hypothetical protein